MRVLDIAEVAERSGVPASTLRYYEELGLIAPVGRPGLRRVFEPDVLERLALIALGCSVGFSLDEIGRMVVPGEGPQIDRALLVARAGDIGRTIRQLTAMRDGLRHAAVCPARSHLECPSFQRLLKLAASGGSSARAEGRPRRRRARCLRSGCRRVGQSADGGQPRVLNGTRSATWARFTMSALCFVSDCDVRQPAKGRPD